MPLRDHFRMPDKKLASWEEVHGSWPSVMAFRLNSLLPADYRCGVKIHLGKLIEIDVGAYESETVDNPVDAGHSDLELAWEATSPTLLLDTEELTPAEYEVLVYDESMGRRLVAAVEIVSPSNKDRASAREEFVSKCHAMLQQQVCVVIVDPVTNRTGNLFAELAKRIGAEPPARANDTIYAVACRSFHYRDRHRVEAWDHTLEIGGTLPTLPLWISDNYYVPLELERTYEETCKGLRIT